MFKTPFNWFNKFGTLPETYKEAMSYEEQIMWLCKEIKDNENFIDEFREEFGEVDEVLTNLQEQINGNHRDILDLQTNKQNKLTAGNGILIQDDTISTAPTYLNFLLQNGALNFNDVNIGDVFDLEPLLTPNCNYLILDVNQGEKIEIIGKFDTALLNNNNEVTSLEKNVEASSFDDPFRWEILSKCKMVVTWYDVNTNIPDIRLFMSSDFIYDELNRKQNKLIAGNGITIQNDVISSTGGGLEPIILTPLITTGSYIDLSGSLGDTVNLTPVSASNTAYYMREVGISYRFTITGNVTVAEIDAENKIITKYSGTGTPANPLLYETEAIQPSNARIIFSFTDTNTYSPTIKYDIDSYSINNTFADMSSIHKLREDLYLDDSSPYTRLIDGLYFTDKYHVYINNTISYQFDTALILVNGSRICVIASPSNNTNHLMYYQVYYDNNQWNFGYMQPSTVWSEISNTPSINNFTADLYLTNGTGNSGLTDGVYFTNNYKVYVNNVESNFFNHAFILSYNGDSLYVISSPYNARQPLGFYEIYYNSDTDTWNTGYQGMQTDWSLVNNKPAGIENYSTSEQVVGTWINGKPLYQKTVTGTMPNFSGTTVNTDIQIDTNVDFAFVKEALLENLAGTTTNFPVIASYFDSGTEEVSDISNTTYISSSKNLRIHQNNDSSNGRTYYITVRYTKTTD